MQLTPMQSEFWRNCTHRWNIKEGATRSGKTYMDYFLIARRLRESHGKLGLRVLIGHTRTNLERNIIDPMRDIYGSGMIGHLKQNNTIDMFGERVYALGADKVSQVAKLQGAGIIYGYGDEIATWNEDVFQMLKSRLSFEESIFDGTCNPDSPNHWFKKFLDSDADIFRQSYTIYDNPKLPKSVIENLEKEYRGTVYYDRFILGKWTAAEGLIYQCFNPETDALPHVPERLTGRNVVAIDYGTENACVFLLIQEGVSGTWYVAKEYYYSGRKERKTKSDVQYVQDLKDFIRGLNVSSIVVDPSAASFITALRQEGIFVIRANNAVLDGIRKTINMLNTGKLKVCWVCENLIRELGSYRWNPKKDYDEPVKEDDHCCDALRYFVNTFDRLVYNPFN